MREVMQEDSVAGLSRLKRQLVGKPSTPMINISLYYPINHMLDRMYRYFKSKSPPAYTPLSSIVLLVLPPSHGVCTVLNVLYSQVRLIEPPTAYRA